MKPNEIPWACQKNESFKVRGVSGIFLFFSNFKQIALKAKIDDPDQTPHYGVSTVFALFTDVP